MGNWGHSLSSMNSFGNKNCTDEALAGLAKNGDRDAENELIVRSLPTVKFLVSTFSTNDNSVGEEDFIQEALLGVLNAIHSYDEARGASFMTFASRCALNRLLTFSKRTSARLIPQVELEEAEQFFPDTDGPESRLLDEENYKRFIKSVRNSLTETELTVLGCYLKGMSYELISSQTGLSRKSVDNALFRARKKIKAMR